MPQGTGSYRIPTRLVWSTETSTSVADPVTGKKRKAKRYIVRWREGRKVRERSFEDHITAGRFQADKHDELSGGRGPLRGATTTFSEWADRYLRSRHGVYLRWRNGEIPSLPNGYPRLLNGTAERFVEVAGDRPLAEYRSSDFDAFRTALTIESDEAGRPRRRATTVESYLQRLRTFFLAAYKERLLDRAPDISVRSVPFEKPVLTSDEIAAIFEAARAWPKPEHTRRGSKTGRLYPILATLYYSGVRRAELIHLRVEDVAREGGVIVEIRVRPKEWWSQDDTGRRVLRKWVPKAGKSRAIPVHPRLAEVLEAHLAETGNRQWLFTNASGRRWKKTSLSSIVRRFAEIHGFDMAFHVWRRSAITHLHDAGVAPGHVQGFAGHSSLAMTMKYVRPSAKGRREAVRALPSL